MIREKMSTARVEPRALPCQQTVVAFMTLRKLHTRPALTWTAVSTIIRSHRQALGNLTNEYTPVGFEPSISEVKIIHSTT